MLIPRNASVAVLATHSTLSSSRLASITVALVPAPVIVSGAVPVTFRSPLVLSSTPAGGIESTYRPEWSTILFDLRLAVPQSVRRPGESTAAIASRNEHLRS
jgi:hypothetical protein